MIRLVYYPFAILLTVLTLSFALEESRLNRIANSHLDIEHTTEVAWKSVLETLTFSLYSGATDSRSKLGELFTRAVQQHSFALRSAGAFLIVTSVFLFVQFWRTYRDSVLSEVGLTADVLSVSMLCLVVGLVAPIFSLKASTALPLLGEVVLKFETKSIVTTISSLVKSDSYFLALLIATFSIITPVLKMLIAILVVQRRWSRWHRRGLDFVKAIGKWSMTDVFVVAILVAYFAASGDEFSDASSGFGVYFFAAYCLLSWLATHCLMRAFDSGISANGGVKSDA